MGNFYTKKYIYNKCNPCFFLIDLAVVLLYPFYLHLPQFKPGHKTSIGFPYLDSLKRYIDPNVSSYWNYHNRANMT